MTTSLDLPFTWGVVLSVRSEGGRSGPWFHLVFSLVSVEGGSLPVRIHPCKTGRQVEGGVGVSSTRTHLSSL